uniref:Dual specificity phosphatase catalytic domain-containing protein n=1 Tax=Oryzias latipes TaxID=8090 RepID=A0A3B3HNC9_ORYLA
QTRSACPVFVRRTALSCRRQKDGTEASAEGSCVPGELSPCLSLIPCTCSRGTRHSWSRLKVDIGDMSDTLFNGQPLKLRCFEDINECINASTEKRKRVLVHCRDGFSLAPTCIIQYLMVKQNMRLIAAYELLGPKCKRFPLFLSLLPGSLTASNSPKNDSYTLREVPFYEQDPNNQRSSSTHLDYM